MRSRNRSPALIALVLVGGLLFGLSAFAAEVDTKTPDRIATAGQAETKDSEGLQVRGSFTTKRQAASSCRKGKRTVGTSASYVARGAIKSLTADCYSCCAEVVFIDNFEDGDTSAWSAVVDS